jgi:hypothetical protein
LFPSINKLTLQLVDNLVTAGDCDTYTVDDITLFVRCGFSFATQDDLRT